MIRYAQMGEVLQIGNNRYKVVPEIGTVCQGCAFKGRECQSPKTLENVFGESVEFSCSSLDAELKELTNE